MHRTAKNLVIYQVEGRVALVESDAPELEGAHVAVFDLDDDTADMTTSVRLVREAEITKYAQRSRAKSQECGLAWLAEDLSERFAEIAKTRGQSAEALRAALRAELKRGAEQLDQAMGLQLPIQSDIKQRAIELLGRGVPTHAEGDLSAACDRAQQRLAEISHTVFNRPQEFADEATGVIEGLREKIIASLPPKNA